MRFRHPDGSVVHLSYASNVHPAETVDGILRQLRTHAAGVRRALGADRLGVGLWLPAKVAAVLAEDRTALDEVASTLAAHHLEVVTVNAFPYGGFHDEVVKRAVYLPDWSEQARLDYTLDCARVLARLLPADAAEGSISSLPLGWRTPWYADRDGRAREQLARLAEGLADVRAESGRTVRVGLEPEPGCVVETTGQAVDRLAGAVDPEHVGVCLDACHLATEFEDGPAAVDRVTAAGLPVVKTQASAALHAEHPADPATRRALADFAEDRFLHQVRERRGGRVVGRDDLDLALAGERPLPGRSAWRVHFHVPLHADLEPPLASTRPQLEATLGALVGGACARTRHVEVETYTWGVLPERLRPRDDAGLVAGIAAEVGWAARHLVGLGLQPLDWADEVAA